MKTRKLYIRQLGWCTVKIRGGRATVEVHGVQGPGKVQPLVIFEELDLSEIGSLADAFADALASIRDSVNREIQDVMVTLGE